MFVVHQVWTREKIVNSSLVPGCTLALSHGFRQKSVAVDCILVVLGANHAFSATQFTRLVPPQCCSDHAGYDPRRPHGVSGIRSRTYAESGWYGAPGGRLFSCLRPGSADYAISRRYPDRD